MGIAVYGYPVPGRFPKKLRGGSPPNCGAPIVNGKHFESSGPPPVATVSSKGATEKQKRGPRKSRRITKEVLEAFFVSFAPGPKGIVTEEEMGPKSLSKLINLKS